MASITCPKCNTENKLPTKKCKDCGFVFKFQEIAVEPIEIEDEEVEEIEEAVVPIKTEDKPKKELKEIIIKETPEDIRAKKRIITALTIVSFLYLAIIILPNYTINTILDTILNNSYGSFYYYTNGVWSISIYNVLSTLFFAWPVAIGILSIGKKRTTRLIGIIMTIANIVAQVVSMIILLLTTLNSGFNNLLILLALIIWTSIQIMSLNEKKEA